MAITLYTGLPGHGKTLRAIFDIEKKRREGLGPDDPPRVVYYDGIAKLTLDWIPLPKPGEADFYQPVQGLVTEVPPFPSGLPCDAKIHLEAGHGWYRAPAGALVVIDEAQRMFRPRGVGSMVPTHVQQLEVHRHRGLDLIIITQHPRLIDSNVRALVDTHIHVKRVFNLKRATIFRWPEVNENPKNGRGDAEKSVWPYPPEVFKYYQSATMHTARARIPKAAFLAVAAFAAFLALAFVAVQQFRHYYHLDSNKPAQAASAGNPIENTAIKLAGVERADRALSPAEYIADRTERIPGLAYTAPAYDGVVKPQVAPAPDACMATKHRCQCFTQQATPLIMPDAVCRQIAANGIFEDWRKPDATPDRRSAGTVAAARPALSSMDQAFALRSIPEGAVPVVPPNVRPIGDASRRGPGWLSAD